MTTVVNWDDYPSVNDRLLAALARSASVRDDYLEFVHTVEVFGRVYLVATDGYRLHLRLTTTLPAGLVLFPTMLSRADTYVLIPVEGIRRLNPDRVTQYITPEHLFPSEPVYPLRTTLMAMRALNEHMDGPGRSLCAVVDGPDVPLAEADDWRLEVNQLLALQVARTQKAPHRHCFAPSFLSDALEFVRRANRLALPTSITMPLVLAEETGGCLTRIAAVMPLCIT